MATDAVQVKWIYPPNWDGNPPEDGKSGWGEVAVLLTGQSANGGETDVVKVDISELRTNTGAVPTKTAIMYIEWDALGYTELRLEWDRAPNALILDLGGTNSGKMNFRKKGGLVDPGEAGDRTGDIMLTEAGGGATDVYNIYMEIKLKE